MSTLTSTFYSCSLYVHYSCAKVNDANLEYQKYKCSENVDEECIHHLREVVRRKGNRMMEAGNEKQYWRKKWDALREILDSKDPTDPVLQPQKGKDDIDNDESEDEVSDDEGSGVEGSKDESSDEEPNYKSDMENYDYDKEPTHDMVAKVTDEIPKELDYTSEDLGL